MSFFENLTDDQLALFGSALAIVFCFGVLVVTPGLRHWGSQLTKPKTQTRPGLSSRGKRVPSH